MIETVEQRLARLKGEAKTREARAAEYRDKMNPGGGEMETQSPKAGSSCAADGETKSGTPQRDSRQQSRDHDQLQVRVLPSRPSETPQEKWRKKNKKHLAEYQRLYRAAEKLKKKHP